MSGNAAGKRFAIIGVAGYIARRHLDAVRVHEGGHVVDVHLCAVDVDLHHLASTSANEPLRRLQLCSPDSLAAPFRRHIQLVQQPDRTGVPDIRPQGEDGEPDGR